MEPASKQTRQEKKTAATSSFPNGTGQPAKIDKKNPLLPRRPKRGPASQQKTKKKPAATSSPKRGRPASKKTTLNLLGQVKYRLPITL